MIKIEGLLRIGEFYIYWRRVIIWFELQLC